MLSGTHDWIRARRERLLLCRTICSIGEIFRTVTSDKKYSGSIGRSILEILPGIFISQRYFEKSPSRVFSCRRDQRRGRHKPASLLSVVEDKTNMTLAQKPLRAKRPVYSPARWLKCLDRKADSPGFLFYHLSFLFSIRGRTKTV